MPVYKIVDVKVRDPEAFEVVEGDWQPTRLVLFRFPDRTSVKAFYEDPEYQDLLALRHRVADTSIVVVDGL